MTTTQESNDFRFTCYFNEFETIVEENEGETFRGSILKRWPAPPEDPTAEQWMRLEETSSIYDLWSHEDEDVYTESDGTPL